MKKITVKTDLPHPLPCCLQAFWYNNVFYFQKIIANQESIPDKSVRGIGRSITNCSSVLYYYVVSAAFLFTFCDSKSPWDDPFGRLWNSSTDEIDFTKFSRDFKICYINLCINFYIKIFVSHATGVNFCSFL